MFLTHPSLLLHAGLFSLPPQLSVNTQQLCTFEQPRSFNHSLEVGPNNSVTNWSRLLALVSQAIRKKVQSLIQTFSILQTDEPATSEAVSVRSLTARRQPELVVSVCSFCASDKRLVQTLKFDNTPPLTAF